MPGTSGNQVIEAWTGYFVFVFSKPANKDVATHITPECSQITKTVSEPLQAKVQLYNSFLLRSSGREDNKQLELPVNHTVSTVHENYYIPPTRCDKVTNRVRL